ncbi:Cytochrome b-c1 complex subunit 6, mitochondrial [Microsporum canis]|uniref:Cytochrome b-c1 complex subunit 6, mitochondrial n=1 Tax=Arthroderma otae (strain ATCC MYA-4605 / CBS 113480) TaxID=554155 RepID=C5FUF7_ARTOC|nr:ubiquinol-cytochrome c reductase complex 17 kd protein [Microsporum canis CBS 113480]EEQ33541.1 ubiquinol-cytochrome c reductase complex 17 kd protein [Microsporum canis CBS 113480]
MGIADMFVDFVSSLSFGEVVEAEAPPAEEVEESSSAEDTPDEDKSEDAEEEEAEEEEEEEEEEAEDIMPKLIEECSNSKPCAPVKHHFDHCVERVTRNSEDPDFKGPHEDCVEEFFHLQHCATQCAAPKLFRELK